MTGREPKRTRKSWSTSPDLFKSSGGFTRSAKAGRTFGVSEHRPFGSAPTQPKKGGKA
ncbi:hypothetical protein [Micromonospora carbonacea]|uniref:Uncharacterized protein n=1 Tax=Micromonospora carbonacea TaxID=47853 RepID=A0A1C5A393_9ACTN|nr:hypothetical protein [Micromonospora carbonacea]SCF39670.1 hypothetical protein GA0070563_11150 [Micromonospora carbonacea]